MNAASREGGQGRECAYSRAREESRKQEGKRKRRPREREREERIEFDKETRL